MNLAKIDRLNTLLIFISFIIAYNFPFELFIIIYALLGPLHYLTEINWIRDKQYFNKGHAWGGSMLLFAAIVTLPFIFALIGMQGKDQGFLKLFEKHSITLLPIAFLVAFLSISSFSRRTNISLLFAGLAMILLVSFLPAYQILIGVFLPTVIHVYFFTLLFMWYGVLRSKSGTGKLNIFLMVFLPLFLITMKIDPVAYNTQNILRSTFAENKFYSLNAHISGWIGASDGKHFSFQEVVFIKIQIFIAFAYTYHYLNWFSKTTVIGWHKNLTRGKSLTIIIVWLAAVALYWYNYKAGVAIILFLSMLHVLLEFPLNIITIKAIYGSLTGKKQKLVKQELPGK